MAAAAAVSVPYDLDAGARALEESAMGRRYAGYFLDSLTAKVRGKRALLSERIDVEEALRSRIRVPTLLIHARDDPFLPWERIPATSIDANPWLVGAFTHRGGHVDFLEGHPGRRASGRKEPWRTSSRSPWKVEPLDRAAPSR